MPDSMEKIHVGGHAHIHSVLIGCKSCLKFGIPFPNDFVCGNCGSESTYSLVPACCVRAAVDGQKLRCAEAHAGNMNKAKAKAYADAVEILSGDVLSDPDEFDGKNKLKVFALLERLTKAICARADRVGDAAVEEAKPCEFAVQFTQQAKAEAYEDAAEIADNFMFSNANKAYNDAVCKIADALRAKAKELASNA